jgi:hypothetical protein
MADWNDLNLGFAGAITPLAQGLNGTLGGVSSILNAAVTALQVLASFLQAVQSPQLAAILTLKGEIENLLQDLEETGVYGLFLVPDSLETLSQYTGGYGKFRQLFLESLHDVEDANRPQINQTGALGGVILYLSSDNPLELVLQGQELFSYFSRPLTLQIPPPVNLSVSPVYQNGSGDLTKSSALQALLGETTPPNALLFEWQEPRYANDVLYDFFQSTSFVLERSRSRTGSLLLAKDPNLALQGPLSKEGAPQPLLDSNGQPQTYWEPVEFRPGQYLFKGPDLINSDDGVLSFGFLSGSYACLLTDVDKGSDSGYFYRVRSVPTNTLVTQRTYDTFSDNTLKSQSLNVLVYEGEVLPTSLSPASLPVRGVLPEVDSTTFDVATAVLNVYRGMYQLRFDESFTTFLGPPVLGNEVLSPKILQSLWNTTPGTSTFTDAQGTQISYFESGLFDTILNYRSAVQDLSEDLVANIATFDPFGGTDEFLLPSFSLPAQDRIRVAFDKASLPAVKKIAGTLIENEGLLTTFTQFYQALAPTLENALTQGVTEDDLLGNTSLRPDLYSIYQLISGFGRVGQPPNWESLKLLEDLFPDLDELTGVLFGLIESFETTLADSTTEFEGALQGIQDRLNVVTSLIDQVDALLSRVTAILSLSFDINVLYIPPAAGGNARITQELLNAGNPPDSGPEDYFISIALLAGGPSVADVTAITNVFSLLFGV